MNKQKTTIKIINSLMGTFKTSNIFKQINNDMENNYIYVTPYLDEVERCKEACKDKRFYEPKQMGKGKLDSLHKLLLEEKNIATTHALFKMANEETYQLLKSNNYILVLDEVMSVVEQISITKDDLETLKEKYLDIDESGSAKWRECQQGYKGEFEWHKNMANNDSLIVYGDIVMLWSFPVKVFQCFKESYILTYLFEAQIQKYYFDRFNVEYEYYYSDKNGYHLMDNNFSEKERKDELKKLINIYNGNLNKIGDGEFTLSKSWYNRNSKKTLMEKLQKNVFSYFLNNVGTGTQLNMWTTFKDYKNKIKGKGYTRGFVTLNARATNVYSHKESLAYCCNIFVTPILVKYFNMHDIEVNQDLYATSELLQWIWRSRIRNNKSINILLPSERMRNLLICWLNDEEYIA